jgi:hypothetical protein
VACHDVDGLLLVRVHSFCVCTWMFFGPWGEWTACGCTVFVYAFGSYLAPSTLIGDDMAGFPEVIGSRRAA